jgi:UDP-N-acetylmuramoylalanine--D-glutamate ligase
VTLLTQHVLQKSGRKAAALGNVGTPLASYVKESDPSEILVVELSSFQLETMKTAVFNVGIILNITPNHLNRHASMEEYAGAKCRLQTLIKPTGSFWVHESVRKNFGPMIHPFYQTYGESVEEFLKIGYTTGGKHDLENAQAAWIICRSLGVKGEEFVEALKSFKKPPHRIEFVTSWYGVDYFNDSKSSSIDATIKAVEAMKDPVVLIVGGVDKGSSYLPWKEVFKGKVKKVIAIGEAAPKIAAELKPEFEIEMKTSLEAAVTAAAQAAQSGECVLLSPGCSSYDMFENYAHRGDVFKNFVLRRER